MKFRGKIIYPAAFFAAAVFVAEGVSGFTSAQLSLFYQFLKVLVTFLIGSFAIAISSVPLFFNRVITTRKRKTKENKKGNYR